MQNTKTREPFVEFVDHHTQFIGPYSPRSAALSARSASALAAHTKAVFAMFRPDSRIRLAPNWMDKFETMDGKWGGHISLAWRSGGQWLFVGRSGLAVLGKQPGFFDWVRFEQRRRRFPDLKKALDNIYLPPLKVLEQMEHLRDKPLNLPVPIPLELWVVINKSAKQVEIRGLFSRSFGRVEAGAVMSFIVWEHGRYPLYVLQGNRQAGRIEPELEFVPSGGSRVRMTILRLPSAGGSLEMLGDVTGVKGRQPPAGRFGLVFDKVVLALVE